MTQKLLRCVIPKVHCVSVMTFCSRRQSFSLWDKSLLSRSKQEATVTQAEKSSFQYAHIHTHTQAHTHRHTHTHTHTHFYFPSNRSVKLIKRGFVCIACLNTFFPVHLIDIKHYNRDPGRIWYDTLEGIIALTGVLPLERRDPQVLADLLLEHVVLPHVVCRPLVLCQVLCWKICGSVGTEGKL